VRGGGSLVLSLPEPTSLDKEAALQRQIISLPVKIRSVLFCTFASSLAFRPLYQLYKYYSRLGVDKTGIKSEYIARFLKRKLNLRCGLQIYHFLLYTDKIFIWDMIRNGKAAVGGSFLQRMFDVSPCFGDDSSFLQFPQSDLDVYCTNELDVKLLKDRFGFHQAFADIDPGFYQSTYILTEKDQQNIQVYSSV
jgi:hypothetical protein